MHLKTSASLTESTEIPGLWCLNRQQKGDNSRLNLASVARDCHVNRKTAEGYLGVLEDLLLGFRLNVFTRRAKRELATHPKFYYFDTGVFRANRPSGPLDSPGGHFKIPHPWPGQNPPPDGDGQRMITR